MTDATLTLLIALAIGLGVSGTMVLAWHVVEAARAMRQTAQQTAQIAEASLKVLTDGMAALTKELEVAHEIAGIVTEQVTKMWKRSEPAGVGVRAYSKPLPGKGEAEEEGEISPLSREWRSPRMEEEIRRMEESKEKEQWENG